MSLGFRELIKLEILFQRKRISVLETFIGCIQLKESTGHFFSELQKSFGSHEEIQLYTKYGCNCISIFSCCKVKRKV